MGVLEFFKILAGFGNKTAIPIKGITQERLAETISAMEIFGEKVTAAKGLLQEGKVAEFVSVVYGTKIPTLWYSNVPADWEENFIRPQGFIDARIIDHRGSNLPRQTTRIEVDSASEIVTGFSVKGQTVHLSSVGRFDPDNYGFNLTEPHVTFSHLMNRSEPYAGFAQTLTRLQEKHTEM